MIIVNNVSYELERKCAAPNKIIFAILGAGYKKSFLKRATEDAT